MNKSYTNFICENVHFIVLRERGREMKKLVVILIGAVLLLSLSSCGKEYTCNECGKKTSKAYYDLSAIEEQVMCEDCARQYWMPLDYRNYRVK